ncbi:MAG: hypothetical protein WCT23_03995 [Candidatus Neomarinimicrobiota bacterium]|jgi:hypothetical protein
MKLTKKEVKDIAEWLSADLEVFINLDDNTIKYLIPEDDMDYYETENPWAKDMAEIKSWENCLKLEPLESWQCFRFMENFIETLDDHQMQARLEIALQKRHPFSNFKHAVDNSEYRQAWFEYRDEQYLQAVIKNLPLELMPDDEGGDIPHAKEAVDNTINNQFVFNSEELKMLYKHLFIGNWVLTAKEDEYLSDYTDFLKMMLKKLYPNDVTNLIEIDPFTEGYDFTEDFSEEIIEEIHDYDNSEFWLTLTGDLAKRDLIENIGDEKFSAMDVEEKIKAIMQEEKKYIEEFEDNGIDNLIIRKFKKY